MKNQMVFAVAYCILRYISAISFSRFEHVKPEKKISSYFGFQVSSPWEDSSNSTVFLSNYESCNVYELAVYVFLSIDSIGMIARKG